MPFDFISIRGLLQRVRKPAAAKDVGEEEEETGGPEGARHRKSTRSIPTRLSAGLVSTIPAPAASLPDGEQQPVPVDETAALGFAVDLCV